MCGAEKGGQENEEMEEEKELDCVLVPLGLAVFVKCTTFGSSFPYSDFPQEPSSESRHQWVFSMMSVRPPKALDEDETGFLDKLEPVR
ncbi:hypothetical protein RHMOL_Rhmol12G0163700 [Rhododendron molle]|uniref:Uncharacterized protein n=1 Tax=Rhododendron molle TaxID=49168 RepID=A0ACC0LJ52_RHOML|nr:hypothetical protein RHMOL_Rhmol12G0163700 [Rhododendron molle]